MTSPICNMRPYIFHRVPLDERSSVTSTRQKGLFCSSSVLNYCWLPDCSLPSQMNVVPLLVSPPLAWNFIRVQHTEPERSHNLAAAPRSLHCRSLRAEVQPLWNLQHLLEICQSFSQQRVTRNNAGILCCTARNIRITSAEDRWSGRVGFWRCKYSDHL